ncbi:hypothetical protein BAE44_0007519 [Dichanthelium oligosanthes]|uniref:Uncharacterized protein n=1 Tax=Dichanthelium oligosanthes TaxID=888268 RepID=A0A1E5W266_9POAL|nr:hypothetical protein BAE44_0007519 [Dichanthelium oligosanthes]
MAVAVAALVAVAAPRCAAQTTSGCTLSIISLAPSRLRLSFTAGNASTPSSYGVTVNATLALELHGKCNAVGAPLASPPSTATPAAGSAPAATVEAPTPDAVSSHAGITKTAAVSVSFVVAIVSLMAF